MVADDFEIKNGDTKIIVYEKEVKLKSKVQFYLFRRQRYNEFQETKKKYFDKFSQDLSTYFNY